MPKFHLYQPVRVVGCCYPELIGQETITTEFHPKVCLDRAKGIHEPGWRSTIPHPQANIYDKYAWFGESQLEPIIYRPSDEEMEEEEKEPELELVLVTPKEKVKVKSW